eukprot:Unigene6419_Nuclearia_a/m.19784 Unigene6419_Nuclearia_a/g.19784  ORF Unigene6419_Nuclearia_a/g.19784 Unigene6419_Nuclearia_a/m.19784 type:complete len:170 (+) Unigene6419_Nuclearia_a:109-618(+)
MRKRRSTFTRASSACACVALPSLVRSLAALTAPRQVVLEYPMPAGKFTNYFVAYVPAGVEIPEGDDAKYHFVFSMPGVIELCHNWGTETDPEFKGYHNGNSDPRGFGHIAIAVPDMDAAVARFDALDVPFQKRPEAGMMKGIAFIRDPDGYWIELVCPSKKPWLETPTQ